MDSSLSTIIEAAKIKGICADGYNLMRGMDKEGMVDYYLANLDWPLERGVPDLQTLVDKFSDCEKKGIYVGQTFNNDTLNSLQTYVFHDCKEIIRVGLNIDKAIIPMLYFANGCDMVIEGIATRGADFHPSVIPLYIFGENSITADDTPFVAFKKFHMGMLEK